MESRAHYILVGSFVLIAALALVACLLWLSDAGGGKNASAYTVYFRKQSLDGLQKDSDVTMKGIKVGRVAAYQISSRNIEEVRVTLMLDEGAPIKVDTVAVIKRNLLTGLARVDLEGGTSQSAELTEVVKDEDYPVIPEGRSELARLAESIPGVLESFDDMTSRASTLFSDDNLNSVRNTLANVEQITKAFVGHEKQYTSILKAIENVALDISKLSKSVDKLARDVDANVAEVSQESVATLKEAQKSMTQIDRSAKQIAVSVDGASQVFSQEMTAISQGIVEASQTLSKTLEDFENPKSIIAGPSEGQLGPGERIAE